MERGSQIKALPSPILQQMLNSLLIMGILSRNSAMASCSAREGNKTINPTPHSHVHNMLLILNIRIYLITKGHTFSSSVSMLCGPQSTSHWGRRIPVLRTVSFGRPG